MSYLLESAQRELARYDRLADLEQEDKFCSDCGALMDSHEYAHADICYACIEANNENETNKP